MGIDVKVPFPKVPLSKVTGHTKSTFQKNSLGNMLPQDIGEEMDIIIANTVHSKISPFLKLNWEEQHQLEFVTIIVQNPLLFIFYI